MCSDPTTFHNHHRRCCFQLQQEQGEASFWYSRPNPSLTSMSESSSHKITSQRALQTAAPPSYTNIEFSQPRHVNPTAPMLTAINLTGSNNYDYPTAQHYSGGQCTFAGDAPLQYPIMPTPTHSSTPAGTIQQSQSSVVNRQEPDGALIVTLY